MGVLTEERDLDFFIISDIMSWTMSVSADVSAQTRSAVAPLAAERCCGQAVGTGPPAAG
jgi:hypothetical protein